MNNPAANAPHPPVIEQILRSAPPHAAAALRAYMDLLVLVVDRSKVIVEKVCSQRDRAVGTLDELMAELQAVTMSVQDKAAAEDAMGALMTNLTRSQS